MDKREKLDFYLKNYQIGDIVLTRGSNLMARTIKMFDKRKEEDRYFNHCGLVLDMGGQAMILESLGGGVTPTYLRDRVEQNQDFTILRPLVDYDEREYAALKLNLEVGTGLVGRDYDDWLLPKIALARTIDKVGIKGLNWVVSDNTAKKDICSETVRRYTNYLGLFQFMEATMLVKTGRSWLVPMDFKRHGRECMEEIV